MPVFQSTQVFPRSVEEVFAFFRDPANLVRVSPPELQLRLVEGPERLQLGSVLVLQGRRWGIPQRVVSEVTAFEPNVSFTDVQRQGPFRKWQHTHRFEAVPEGTRVTDVIEFEPPGGLLGLVVTAAWIEADLKGIFEYRTKELAKLLGSAAVAPPGTS
jgi:ligand-binding SRPBCC domain-containing protein